jgi:uncharacterized protein (TIGR02217 family)
MSFIDARLPTQVEIGAMRRDVEEVEVVTTDGGWEQRNLRRSQSLLEFDISYPHAQRDDEVYLAVKAMYKASRGGGLGFRFKDWSDYQASAAVFGTGDGTTTAFQLGIPYTAGSTTHTRRITRPITPVSIFIDGVVTATATVNYSTGAVTFSPAPADDAVLSWTGEFDIPVRFDGPLSIAGPATHLLHLESITLLEIME